MKPKRTQQLDRFPEIDYKVFAHVAEHGHYAAELATSQQCQRVRFRFYRLREALLARDPDNPLAQAARNFTISARDRVLIVMMKTVDGEADLLGVGLSGNEGRFLSTDKEAVLEHEIAALDSDATKAKVREEMRRDGATDDELRDMGLL